MLRPARRLFGAWSSATLLFLGCSYSSEYIPPQDGRARSVWQDNRVVMVLPGRAVTLICEQELQKVHLEARSHPKRATAPGTIWEPQTFADDPKIFDPRLVDASVDKQSLLPKRSWFSRNITDWIFGRFLYFDPSIDSVPDAGLRLLLDSISIFTPVNLWLAINPPGLWAISAREIDRVNIYNDLTRTPTSNCAYNEVWNEQ